MSATIDFGIDLGTTNSSIACCRGGDVRIFPNTDQMNVTPSVVYIGKTGRMLVGRKAYDTWVSDPQNTQAEFKRWMGLSDTQSFPASGKTMSAEELSAEVLKALRADAERQTQEQVTAAVITVPAAFGSLQCDATARAAKAAGFTQSPLLQEPIAAAIAYGAGPAAKNQRWMVFDLGGGTLDIAVVSTRNGRLAVLEHQGNNRLGGKDLDRLIAESLFLEPLKQTFALPDRLTDARAYDKLLRALVRQAEQTKIVLSTAPDVVVELFDLGDDRDGKPIELTLTLTRAELEARVQPLVEQCLQLARRALEGARLANADLDRILLVGGPTQMPIIRSALESGIGARLDTSLDPMTVVARGAALYASTLAREAPAGAAAAPVAKPAAGVVAIQLSSERASGTVKSPVAGVVPASSGIHEVKIDADGGFWTSGWVPLAGGCFQLDVMLTDRKPLTQYTLAARDRSGREIRVSPDRFSITFMLPMAAPPLPHTIGIELATVDGITKYDPIFERHCPLPAEVRKTYRADRTLRPSETESTLPLKFWEIAVSDDPQERWWAGCVHIRADKIKRPILEGSELELTVKIDPSRKMTVEVFVPLLNQSFVEGVYVPDAPSARSKLQEELDLCFERLNRIRRAIYESDRSELNERAEMLQLRLESICEQVDEDQKRGNVDPDAALAPTEQLRRIRMQLAQLEEQLETDRGSSDLARRMRGDVRWTQQVVAEHGTDADKAELARLMSQYQRYSDANDTRALRWVGEQLSVMRGSILEHQPSFWQNLLRYLQQPSRRFVNQSEAQIWLQKAEKAHADQNLPQLREAVNKVWNLQPPDQVEAAKEQAAQSGLRGV